MFVKLLSYVWLCKHALTVMNMYTVYVYIFWCSIKILLGEFNSLGMPLQYTIFVAMFIMFAIVDLHLQVQYNVFEVILGSCSKLGSFWFSRYFPLVEQSASSTAPMGIVCVWAHWSATSSIIAGTTAMRRTAPWSPSTLRRGSSTVSALQDAAYTSFLVFHVNSTALWVMFSRVLMRFLLVNRCDFLWKGVASHYRKSKNKKAYRFEQECFSNE